MTTPASCHSDGGGVQAPPGTPILALAGAPNVGKSTLFNRLTGARRDVGNWPGTTVEVGRGLARQGPDEFDVIDLPGAYSLDPHSPDEELTRRLLLETPPGERPDVVVVVADAGRLPRSLYLVRELREVSLRLVVALTMGDVAQRHGIAIDTASMAREIGVPVVAIDPRHRHGRVQLFEAITEAMAHPAPTPLTAPAGDELEVADTRFAWIEDVLAGSVSQSGTARIRVSDRIDRIALSPVLGPLLLRSSCGWCSSSPPRWRHPFRMPSTGSSAAR